LFDCPPTPAVYDLIEEPCGCPAGDSVGRHRYGSVAAPPEDAFAPVALPGRAGGWCTLSHVARPGSNRIV